MAQAPALPASGGQLAANIMHFARVLRRAGLPVGPGKVLDAVQAVDLVGITNREDFYWTLHSVFVNRRDQRELFDQAFHVFWRNPQILEKIMSMVVPTMTVPPEEDQEELSRRLAEALQPNKLPGEGPGEEEEPEEIEFDAVLTFSEKEVLRTRDFEKMSNEEMDAAKRAIARMRLPIMDVPTRRFRPTPASGRIDMRATLKKTMRGGSDSIFIARKQRRRRPPPLVILCDISGSMERYSRMLLHFMHALTNDRDRVHTFTFGTRLTNITRQLRHKDVDVALEKVGQAAEDWSGGTRIGTCLHDFNRFWSRRVLAQGAIVLFISDGLDRDAAEGLEEEMERLHKSCRRLIWLNPLLRYEGFQPRSSGIKAILPHVDDFRTIHNLQSLHDLADVLGRLGERQEESVTQWLKHRPN